MPSAGGGKAWEGENETPLRVCLPGDTLRPRKGWWEPTCQIALVMAKLSQDSPALRPPTCLGRGQPQDLRGGEGALLSMWSRGPQVRKVRVTAGQEKGVCGGRRQPLGSCFAAWGCGLAGSRGGWEQMMRQGEIAKSQKDVQHLEPVTPPLTRRKSHKRRKLSCPLQQFAARKLDTSKMSSNKGIILGIMVQPSDEIFCPLYKGVFLFCLFGFYFFKL